MLRVLAILGFVALIGLWMGMDWLAYFSIIACIAVLLLMRPEKKAAGAAPKAEVRDTIYPVIYEDAGEPPLLYPKDQIVKIIPNQSANATWEETLAAVGKVGAVGLSLLTGTGRKKLKK